MAQLKDLLVSGLSRLINDVYIEKLQAPTTAGGSIFGLGTDGNVLKSNSSSIYWGKTDLSTEISGILPITNGGTGSSTVNTNTVFAGPNKDPNNPNITTGTPGFRSLVADDLPTVPVTKGGTGVSTAAANTVFAGPVSGSGTPEFRDLTIDDIKGLTIGYCDSADTDTTKVIKLNITEVNKNDLFIFYLANTNSTSNSSSTNLSLTINNNINCDTIYDENIANRLKANATLPKGYYAIKIVQKTGLWTLKPIPIDYKNVSANTVFAGPNNSDGIPSFRTLDAADLPVVPVTKGGTGVSTNVAANTVFAGPASGSGTPEFRRLTKDDINLDINIDALYSNFISIYGSNIYFDLMYTTSELFISNNVSKVLITLNGNASGALSVATTGGTNTGFMTAPLIANNVGTYTLLCMCQNYLYLFILLIFNSSDGKFRFKFYPYIQPLNGTNIILPSSGTSISTFGVATVIIYY